MTKKAKQHLSKIAEMGCIVCGNVAEIHHIRAGCGMAQRASDYLTIPLCPEHHRTGGHGVAIHAGQQTFERLYGSELELLAQVISRL